MASQQARQRYARMSAPDAIAAALVAVTVLFVASVLLRPPGAYLAWSDAGLYSTAFALAGTLAVARGRTPGRDLQGWTVIGIGLLVYTVGNLVWSVSQALGLSDSAPHPSDAFFLAFLPFAFAGMLQLATRRLRLSFGRGWLDALVVGTGAFSVGATVISREIHDRIVVTDPGLIVNSLYLLGDLVLLALAFSVAQAFSWRPPRAWWLLLLGFATFAVTDGSYVVQASTGSYVEGAIGDAGWVVSAAAIGLAAWLDSPDLDYARREGGLTRVAPSLAILIAGAVLLISDPGDTYWVSEAAAIGTLALGVVRMNASVSDATSLAERLRRAEIDPLTGLANQRGLQGLPARRISGTALLLIDLDGFADVNDSLGREAGDALLVEMARRLRQGIRAADVAARLGSDDFAVLLASTSAEEGARIAESLVRLIEEPTLIHGVRVQVSASAGVARVDAGGHALTDALREAGTALQAAKVRGRGVVQTASGVAGQQSRARLEMRAELREALARGGDAFIPHYQPILRVSDGEVLAVEALVRWQRDGRLLGPGQFLDEVKSAGAMGDLTSLMFTRCLGELRAAGLPYPVTINVPPELLDAALVARVQSALESTGSRADQVLIEILEDAIIRDPQSAATVLADLRNRGVQVLLDDFGTGWSGLSTLRDLLVDGLKIDSSFVSAMHVDPTSASIVQAVTGVAHELDLLVVYEGAESPETIEQLARITGAHGQGYGLARPMPIDDLARWSEMRRVRG